MENIGYELLKLASEDRSEFKSLLELVAQTEKRAEVADFVRAIPGSIGME